MSDADGPLVPGSAGPYDELARRPLTPGLVLVFVPSLAALATRAEHVKGAPLTCEEVLRLRDGATVLVSPAEAARAVEERRGYADLDPADPWASWRALRERKG